MRKIIFVLLALLLTLAGCGKELCRKHPLYLRRILISHLPLRKKRNKARCPLPSLPKLPKCRKKPLYPRRKAVLPTVP